MRPLFAAVLVPPTDADPYVDLLGRTLPAAPPAAVPAAPPSVPTQRRPVHDQDHHRRPG